MKKNRKTERIETQLWDKYRLSNWDWNFAKHYLYTTT